MIDAFLDAYGAGDAEKKSVLAYAAERRTLDDLDVQELSASDRRVVLHHAVLLTYADGDQSPDEVRLLEELAKRLRIPDEEAKAVMQAPPAGRTQAEKSLSLLT